MRAEPRNHPFEMRILGCEMSTIDETSRDRRVGVAVFAVEGQRRYRSIIEFDEAGALHVHDERFDRIGEIKDFEAASCERACVDVSTCEIWFELALRVAGGGEPIRSQRVPGRQRLEVRWPPIDRHREDRRRPSRSLQHRLEIRCQEAGLGQDAKGERGLLRRSGGPFSRSASNAARSMFRRFRKLGPRQIHGTQVARKGGVMIVLRPARNIRERHRLDRRLRDLSSGMLQRQRLSSATLSLQANP